MKFILGTKEYMTQVFDEEGQAHAATVLKAGPVVVTQLKNKETDGYKAVQVGFGEQKKERLSKPLQGHFKDLGAFRHVKEVRLSEGDTGPEIVGEKIDISAFEVGDTITVSAISKGKGFQGVVKRHGFAGGRRSHGQKHSEREPGSIGSTGPQRVFKGVKMAGRMGGDRVTVKNLKVLALDTEKGLLIVKGAVPGRRGTVVEVRGV